MYNYLMQIGINIMNFLKNPIITNELKSGEQSIQEGQIKNIQQIADGVRTVLTKIIGPILTAVGTAAVIYAIYLGVMYAKAESADKRKEVQGRLIGACIGAVIIVVGAVLCFAIKWNEVYHNFNSEHTFVDTNKDGICDTCTTK